jgi:hypothetical protein
MLLPYQYRQPPHTDFSTSRRGSTTVGKHGFFGRRYGKSYHVVVEQVAYVDDASPAIGDPLPTSYQFASDRIAPKSTARLYPTKTKFVVKYTPLDLFEKAVHDLRKEELKQKKADELFEKRVKAAEAILTMASMIAGPCVALGELTFLEWLIPLAEIGLHGTQVAHGDNDAWQALLQDGVLEFLKLESVKELLPSWGKTALDLDTYILAGKDAVAEKCRTLTVSENGSGTPPKVRVPADDILDQCYRFRWLVEPAFRQEVKDAESTMELMSRNMAAANIRAIGKKYEASPIPKIQAAWPPGR